MSRLIQISELSFYTDEGRRILEDITLRVDRGELVFLIGPPGSGKTLFLKILYGELRPGQGQILVDGLNVTRIGREKLLKLKRRVGIVPQNPTLIGRKTVYENIIFRLKSLNQPTGEAKRKTEEALKTVGLLDLKDLPLNNLSMTEARKLSIACAISNDPVLLLCDDPFSGLAQEAREEVLETIKRVHRRKYITLIATTRGLKLKEDFKHRKIFLHDGIHEEEEEEEAKVD